MQALKMYRSQQLVSAKRGNGTGIRQYVKIISRNTDIMNLMLLMMKLKSQPGCHCRSRTWKVSKKMANRHTLHSNKLYAFSKWLIKTGWTIEEPKGIWEVLRAKKAGRQNPLIVYQKMNKEHLSVLDRDIDVIKRFLQEK